MPNRGPHNQQKAKAKGDKLHPGMCLCWYPCSYLLIPIMLASLAILGFVLYLLIDFFETMKYQSAVAFTVIAGFFAGILLTLLVQLTFFLIYHESTSTCTIGLFIVTLLLTLTFGLATFIRTFTCEKYCPTGKDFVDTKAAKADNYIFYTQHSRWVSVVLMILSIFVLHIYTYHICCFLQNKKYPPVDNRLQNNYGPPESFLSKMKNKGPQTDRSRDPDVRLIYMRV